MEAATNILQLPPQPVELSSTTTGSSRALPTKEEQALALRREQVNADELAAQAEKTRIAKEAALAKAQAADRALELEHMHEAERAEREGQMQRRLEQEKRESDALYRKSMAMGSEDPGRWWSSKTTPQKVSASIGIALGILREARDTTGTMRGYAGNLIKSAVDEDMERQRAAIKLAAERAERAGKRVEEVRAFEEKALGALDAKHQAGLALVERQLGAQLAKIGVSRAEIEGNADYQVLRQAKIDKEQERLEGLRRRVESHHTEREVVTPGGGTTGKPQESQIKDFKKITDLDRALEVLESNELSQADLDKLNNNKRLIAAQQTGLGKTASGALSIFGLGGALKSDELEGLSEQGKKIVRALTLASTGLRVGESDTDQAVAERLALPSSGSGTKGWKDLVSSIRATRNDRVRGLTPEQQAQLTPKAGSSPAAGPPAGATATQKFSDGNRYYVDGSGKRLGRAP